MTRVVFQTAVACETPRTAAIAFRSAEVIGPEAGVVMICASAPVLCQAAAVSPRAMPLLTIPAKAARVSASTSANAGSTPVSEDRAAADIATKPVAPVLRADSRSRPRTASGYSRSMISTTGTATSTGASMSSRLTRPPACRP